MIVKCPTCKKVAARDGNKAFPFCTERCRMADLGKWLAEEYRVPDQSTPLSEEEFALIERASNDDKH